VLDNQNYYSFMFNNKNKNILQFSISSNVKRSNIVTFLQNDEINKKVLYVLGIIIFLEIIQTLINKDFNILFDHKHVYMLNVGFNFFLKGVG